MTSLVTLQAVCAILGAILGKTYRARELAGFLLGLLLGPLGVLLIFAVSDLRPKCPDCKSVLNAGARKCAKCGAAITALQASR